MISKSLKHLHSLKKSSIIIKNKILNKIYYKNTYLIKLSAIFHDSRFYTIILDKLVYLYKKYNFLVYNDIKSVLFVSSACESLENFKVFYEIFKQKYKNDKETLQKTHAISIIYDNVYVFVFLENTLNVDEKYNEHSFILAAKYGSIKIINYFINNGVDINIKDDIEKKTALMWAAYYGDIETTKIIIEKIVKNREKIKDKDKIIEYNKEYLDIKDDKFGKTAIMFAAENKNKEVIKLLIKNGANLNAKDNSGRTVLMQAIQENCIEIVKFLIEIGASLTIKDNQFKRNALLLAISFGYKNIVEILLNKIIEKRKKIKDKNKIKIYNNKYLNAKDKEGYTALILAAQTGQTEIVKLLIDSGVDLDLQDNYKKTALIYAAENGHTEIVNLLIQGGANLNLQANYGNTALILAAENGHTEIVKLLIENGANINLQGESYKTALILAAENGHTEIVKLLIENGANVNLIDYYWANALTYAVKNNHEDIVKLLISAGTIVSQYDRSGKSSLQYAKNYKIKQLLLEALEKQSRVK